MTKLELIHSVEQARNQPPSSEELQRQLAEKETEIDKRQALIEVKQVIINEHQALIDEKQATINEKQAALDGKQAIIDEMQATLEAIITENQRIVNEKKALVTQKDAIIIRKQSEIERLQDSKDKLQSDLKQKSIANLQAKLLQMKAVTTNDGDTEKASPLLDVTPGEKQLVGHSSENMKFPEPEPKKKPVEQKPGAIADLAMMPALIKFKWVLKNKLQLISYDDHNSDYVYGDFMARLPKRTELVVVNGSVFGGGLLQTPWEYSLSKHTVSKLPLPESSRHPQCYNLVNIDDRLVSVTGFSEKDIDCQIETESFTLEYLQDQIVFSLAPDYGQCLPTCIVYSDFLIVAGGFPMYFNGPHFTPEVYSFNRKTSEWEELSNLPCSQHRMYNFSAVIVNETLYLIDGIHGVVLKISIDLLLFPKIETKWLHAAKASPGSHSPVVINEKFILIFTMSGDQYNEHYKGVSDLDFAPTEPPSVYLYDPEIDQWTRVGGFLDNCLACTLLPSGELFAVGRDYVKTATLKFDTRNEAAARPGEKKSFWSRLRK